MSSGKEKIAAPGAQGVDKGIMEYDADPLRRPSVSWDRERTRFRDNLHKDKEE